MSPHDYNAVGIKPETFASPLKTIIDDEWSLVRWKFAAPVFAAIGLVITLYKTIADKYIFSLTAILLVFAFATVYLALIARLKNYSSLVDLASVVDIVRSENHARISAILEQSYSVAKLMDIKLGPFLVTWETSSRLERNARTVKCITPNLSWAAARIEQFVIEVTDPANSDHSYKYIVFDNELDNIICRRNRKIVATAVARGKCENNIQVLDMNHSIPGEIVPVALPIPTDMVVYEDTYLENHEELETVVVMSVSSLQSPNYRFDYVIREIEFTKRISAWFDARWSELSEARGE